jgi:hypothetical protein
MDCLELRVLNYRQDIVFLPLNVVQMPEHILAY